jgi:hypothetical protein
MSDYSELKALAGAEALSESPRRRVSRAEYDQAFQDFLEEATPATVLALIAENERLDLDNKSLKGTCLAAGQNQKKTMSSLRKASRENAQLKAEIDEDKLHFSAMGKALEGVVAERDKLKAELFEESMMSECMRQFRADMIELGVVGESCPPMMMTEGVSGYIGKLKAEREGLRVALVGKVLIPVEPSDGLLMSMAMRKDHALGCPGYYDRTLFAQGYEGISHARMVEVALGDMRKIYEEVVGAGFYSPEKEADYAAMGKGERS